MTGIEIVSMSTVITLSCGCVKSYESYFSTAMIRWINKCEAHKNIEMW